MCFAARGFSRGSDSNHIAHAWKYTGAFGCVGLFRRQVKSFFSNAPALLADDDFAELMRWCAKEIKLSNMDVERLLAQVRASAPKDRASVERTCSSGMLAQWLHEHMDGGGRHPCAVHRSQLIEEGSSNPAQDMHRLQGCHK